MTVANNFLHKNTCSDCDELTMEGGESFSISEGVFKRLYNKEFGKDEFDLSTYEMTRDALNKSLDKTFAGKAEFNYVDNVMRAKLQGNIAVFSGAKSYVQFKEYREFLSKEDGTPRTFAEFKEKVLEVDIKYNTNWLKTEYNQAVAQAQHAKNWKRFEEDADLYPNLRYVTAGDDRVRSEHAALDGIIRPISDKFWNTYAPSNGWGCRCTLEQEDEDADLTEESEATGRGSSAGVKKMFKNNIGKSEQIFKKGHPYFKLAKDFGRERVTEYKASTNYGMKSAKDIMLKNAKFKKIDKSIESFEAYEQYWDEQVITKGTGKVKEFVLETKLKQKVVLDKKLYTKGKTKELGRYKYAKNIEDTLSTPDEVWIIDNNPPTSRKLALTTVYLKYYKEEPFLVMTGIKSDKKIRVFSFFSPADKKDFSNTESYRRGELMFRK